MSSGPTSNALGPCTPLNRTASLVIPDVGAAQREVLSAGGAKVGEVVTLETATGARVTWCYVRDPEGNVVELQSWA